MTPAILSNLITALGFSAALVIPTITHDVPEGSWVASPGEIASIPELPANVPAWEATHEKAFPGCSPRQSSEPVDLVVVDLYADARRVTFGAAYEVTHNASEFDDVWVVGWCR